MGTISECLQEILVVVLPLMLILRALKARRVVASVVFGVVYAALGFALDIAVQLFFPSQGEGPRTFTLTVFPLIIGLVGFCSGWVLWRILYPPVTSGTGAETSPS